MSDIDLELLEEAINALSWENRMHDQTYLHPSGRPVIPDDVHIERIYKAARLFLEQQRQSVSRPEAYKDIFDGKYDPLSPEWNNLIYKHLPTIRKALSAVTVPEWPLKGRVWHRESTQEWVLELEGTINNTNMTVRHTEPLTTPIEDVPGLPSLHASVPEWNFDMDSAPKDQDLIGFVDDTRTIITWGKVSHIPIYGWIDLTVGGPEDRDLCKPIAWQPLPSPPTDKE